MKEEFPSFTLLRGLSWLVMKEEFLAEGILSRYFTVGHERRVPEVCVFFNADKDLRQPLSLLSFVLYLPAEGKTLSSAHGACDAQPLPSACPYSAAAQPRKSPVPPKLRRFNQLT